MIQEKRVWELFSELVSIDNPSLREEKMCEKFGNAREFPVRRHNFRSE